MTKKWTAEKLTAYATIFLAVVTALMVFATWKLADESRQASYREIGVQTWIEFEKRFDSPEMIRARKTLAKQLRSKPTPLYGDMADTVPNFFEDVGIAFRSGYLDEKLARSSFSIYATRYWEALRPFTDEERRRYGGDNSISENFEFLSKTMLEKNEKVDQRQLEQFLDDEISLTNQ